MDAVVEDRQLEYKNNCRGATTRPKREFVQDVSSFANSVGGDLIYGVREARDAAGNCTGTPESIVGLPGANLDQEKLRLEQLLLNGVAHEFPAYCCTRFLAELSPPACWSAFRRARYGSTWSHMETFGGSMAAAPLTCPSRRRADPRRLP